MACSPPTEAVKGVWLGMHVHVVYGGCSKDRTMLFGHEQIEIV